MLYEEFEKLNCDHIRELNEMNKNILKVFDINDIIVDTSCKDELENKLFKSAYDSTCVLRDRQDNGVLLCHGYDCSTDPFYQTPDKFNTYHNYLVLQDDLINNTPYSCTENHQHFRNWTRRKMPTQQEDHEPLDMGFFDNYLEPIPKVRFRACPTGKKPYQC